ncbi:hypothetical protein BRYFOR_07931 [Marvinbryantia formatexigens DSM 14469]|uniref:DUF1934 domain-containing protein n=1 Tax=Marvinbryantia formatexigens DSM 14469 TaxID=478749 RepID=C6LH21_9FIRM|nr:DUF1934 domain-containing protein [Marvinbryantia formatexigens]EET60080.1 hypothetical protein BRYFOR_07931 [Marvinbryantia formatexigens DSM 14469]UWO23870.1 DUF1934 domain-containing protein [Marvinbryantia formatexigens DSM 14469]SDG51260.1 Uncharacterized beta-barrel protein YwiB, DUF1934 family [Marvinbryantia formatexigens]
MTEDVLVSIRGMQMLEMNDQDEVEIVTNGKYLHKNGKHYISYEEVMEGMEGTTRNLIKVGEDGMEVSKRGLTNVHMVFEKDKKNVTYYETPFGNLMVGIAATNIAVKNDEKNIDVTVNYALDVNYEHLADCTINMSIQSKDGGSFRLS